MSKVVCQAAGDMGFTFAAALHPLVFGSMFVTGRDRTGMAQGRALCLDPPQVGVQHTAGHLPVRAREAPSDEGPGLIKDLSLCQAPLSTDGINKIQVDPTVVRLVSYNVRSLSAQKGIKLKAFTKFCDLLCLSELNMRSDQISLLVDRVVTSTQHKKTAAKVSSLNEICFKNGKRVEGEKTNVYGTGLVSKLSGTEFIETCKNHEIVAARVTYSNCLLLVISVYRSPSNYNHYDINDFYEYLSNLITEQEKKYKFDAVIYTGDDNCDPEFGKTGRNRVLFEAQLNFSKKHCLSSIIKGKFTRKNKQPDSCLVKFEPSKINMSAEIIQDICGSDHDMIELSINFIN